MSTNKPIYKTNKKKKKLCSVHVSVIYYAATCKIFMLVIMQGVCHAWCARIRANGSWANKHSLPLHILAMLPISLTSHIHQNSNGFKFILFVPPLLFSQFSRFKPIILRAIRKYAVIIFHILIPINKSLIIISKYLLLLLLILNRYLLTVNDNLL